MTHHKIQQRGFSLIELMIAIVIMGILASIAMPSYQNYVRQANRAEAKGILLETAQFMERNYTTNNCYHRTDAVCTNGTATITLPFPQSPKTGTAKYAVTVAAASQTYTLSAAPTGGYSDPDCGTLSITNTGTQGQTAGTTATCWSR
jgi:type IV pilus assembly protein PilE